jgi:phage-related holin
MKKILKDYLAHHHFDGFKDLLLSLFPSLKFELAGFTVFVGLCLATLERLLGLDAIAVMMLVVVMLTEIISGVMAAKRKGDVFESSKFSRFTLKLFIYLVLIATPYAFEQSFAEREKQLASEVFSWFHSFIVVEIVFEYIISISENLSVISGKPKDHWVTKIKEVIKSKL